MVTYTLQSRWKIENRKLCYYGLRNRGEMFHNTISLTKKQYSVISSLPKVLSQPEKKILGKLLGKQVVPEAELKKIPKSLSEARFCKSCPANDFIIPGLEFDSDGCCPLCQTAEDTQRLKSIVPLVTSIPKSKHSRFDAALFYTGGKDSTFLLYYLAKVKNLRVLALTWNIPFMSDSALQSIEGAKKNFSTVEFISRTVESDLLTNIYKSLYELSENVCACPSLAYLLFYPELVTNRVPYFLAGNEPVQMLGLYYNHLAPKLAYSFSENKFLNLLVNAGRILTLRPPLKRGQFHTLMTMKQIAYGDNLIKKLSGYSNELVTNVVKAIHTVPELLPPLKRSIRVSSRTGNIPAFVHFDFNEICNEIFGSDSKSKSGYDWIKIKRLLTEKCGWVSPDESNKSLHTSCSLERCKDYSQFLRFYQCRSKLIPFSSLEISLAGRNNQTPKEDIIMEMENFLGLSLDEPPECMLMRNYLESDINKKPLSELKI